MVALDPLQELHRKSGCNEVSCSDDVLLITKTLENKKSFHRASLKYMDETNYFLEMIQDSTYQSGTVY